MTQPLRKHQILASLRVPAFRNWFISQVVSTSGLQTQTVAAAWFVLQATNSPLQLSLVPCVSMLPVLLGSALAGSVIDRHDHRKVLICTQSVSLLLSAALFGLTLAGLTTIWYILLVLMLSGCVNAIDMPARQVFVLDLVGRDRLGGAVSLYEIGNNISRVLGPAIGAAIMISFGAAECFGVNMVSFIPPLLVLLWHRAPCLGGSPPPRDPMPEPERDLASGLTGLNYAFSTPEIRACLFIVASCGILANGTVLYPLLSTLFDRGGSGYGVLVTAYGLGALPGALLAARTFRTPRGRRVLILAAATAFCVGITAAVPVFEAAILTIALSGSLCIALFTTANTFVQLLSAPSLRGRVMGAWTMAMPGMTPFTSLAAGALAQALGIRITLVGLAVLIGFATLVGFRALRD